MSETVTEGRITARPSVGAKACLLVAALLLVAAAYQVLVPLSVTASNGGRFDCRSAAQGPRTELAKNTCGDIYREAETRGAAYGVAALVIGVGGLLTFGLVRRRELPVLADADGAPVDPPDDQQDLRDEGLEEPVVETPTAGEAAAGEVAADDPSGVDAGPADPGGRWAR